MMRPLVLAFVLAGATDAVAQSTSANHFLVSSELAIGDHAGSFVFALEGSFGEGCVAVRAASTQFVLTGGFTATLSFARAPRPWLAGVEPPFAPLLGGTALSLAGTEMDLDGPATVRIGGVAATVTGRQRHAIGCTMPRQLEAGWKVVEVVTNSGSTVLSQGVGVLPMMDTLVPPRSLDPIVYRYRGTAGDRLLWVISISELNQPFVLPGIHGALRLELATHILFGPITVTRPDGLFELTAPGVFLSIPIYVQLLALSDNPGYAPGAFTNVVVVRP